MISLWNLFGTVERAPAKRSSRESVSRTVFFVQRHDLPGILSPQYHIVVKFIPECESSQSGPWEVGNWAEEQSVKRTTEQVT